MKNSFLYLFDYWYDFINKNGVFVQTGDLNYFQIKKENYLFESRPAKTGYGNERIEIWDFNYHIVALFRKENFIMEMIPIFLEKMVKLNPYPKIKAIKK